MNLLTLDVETTMNHLGKSGASHWASPDNKIVLAGYLNVMGDMEHYFISENVVEFKEHKHIDFVVGHNLTFDLHYLYKRSQDNKEFFQKCRLWDTQLAEYLLSGQQWKYAKLDDLCVHYELPLKDKTVTDQFKAGFGADCIPRETLEEYLKQDVYNTYYIAKKQMRIATGLGMLPLIISQMEALHATIEMTYNGLKIDTVYLATYGYGKRIVAEAIEKGFSEEVESVYKRKININSNKELSLFLFGGKVVEEASKCVGMYKNGKPKYKKEKVSKTVDGVVGLTFRKDLKDNAVDEENIRKLIKNLPTGSGLVSILECVLTYRSCYKEYSTYCEGLQEQLFPGNFIYGNISHVTTNTGRLSSSNPNLQNISNSDVKKSFVSRRKNGKLMEFDFSQLEVAVLAHISGDKQLIEDISTGTDIHSALYKDMHGHMPSKEERKWFKTLTFGLLYGAGAKTLATNANCSVETATKFINTFYNRYNGVYQYHEKVLIEPYDVPGRSTECNQFIKTSETQRKYVFKEYENSEWVAKKTKRKYSYSPTELKNYPVQGLATADIVPLMLGLLFRKFIKDSEVHLVNTIHDSILFDVEASAVDRVQHEVFELLNNTHVYYEKTFGVPLRLPLSAGCSVGVNWKDMTECKV